MKAETTTLYRPTGLAELELIYRSGMRAFPPRLPEQPIFYPVLNREYAAQIAREWNSRGANSSNVGFVLRFQVQSSYLTQFETQTVGGREHAELWVPAEELPEFNRHISAPIEIVEAFPGEDFHGSLDPATHLPCDWLPATAPVLFAGKYCRVRRAADWEYVERTTASTAVAILAVTEDERILLVEQFRVPLGRMAIELPAGLAGDITGAESESLSEAAERELLEETGYAAGSIQLLMECASSPGLTNETLTIFRASQLTRMGPAHGDGTESIRLHEVPLSKVDEWLVEKRREGCVIDFKVPAALYLWLRGKAT